MSATPSIFEYLFEFGDIVVIASDGIWDVMSEECVRKYIMNQFNNINKDNDVEEDLNGNKLDEDEDK